MTHSVTWKDGEEQRTQDFPTEEEAKTEAGKKSGIVLVHKAPSGSVTTLRDGRELDGEEASEALLEFTNFGRCRYFGCSDGAADKVKDFRDPERPVIKNMCQRHADLFLREQHEGGLHREKVQNCPLCRPPS
jgi:hypothetical protein